jgi:hypothetical protein
MEAKSRFCRDFGMEHFPQTTRNYPPNHESISLKPRAVSLRPRVDFPPNHESISLKPRAVSLRPRVDFPQTTKTAYKWAETRFAGNSVRL